MKISIETSRKTGIYCIQNILNNKRYIGSSKNIRQRLQCHRSYLRAGNHFNKHLQNSYNKNGEAFFITTLLECCEEKDLVIKEQYYITLFKAEYNTVKEVLIKSYSKETNLKISTTRKRMFLEGTLEPSPGTFVNVYTLSGSFVNTFSHLKKAAEYTNVYRNSISKCLSGECRQIKGYLFTTIRPLTLKDLIFPIKGKYLIVLYKPDSFVIFRSQGRCAKYLNVPLVSIEKFFKNTKRELFKNKYKLGLVKSCELLENLEADNQQPSDIEIY